MKQKLIQGVFMKRLVKGMLLAGMAMTFLATTVEAKWIMVDNTDGAQLMDCCKHKRVVVRKVTPKKKLTPCDEIPTAKTFPVQKGEKLQPANIKRCVSCDQKYGTIK